MTTAPLLSFDLDRTYPAPPERVWAAWTRADLLERWACPDPDWRVSTCEVDARAAAFARAAGVDFEIPDGGETIPLPGFAVVTGFFSVVGVVIAAALLRWSARPAALFVRTAVSLTAISFVPPLLSGANAAATTTLLGLHLVAATVMIATLARSFRTRSVTSIQDRLRDRQSRTEE